LILKFYGREGYDYHRSLAETCGFLDYTMDDYSHAHLAIDGRVSNVKGLFSVSPDLFSWSKYLDPGIEESTVHSRPTGFTPHICEGMPSASTFDLKS